MNLLELKGVGRLHVHRGREHVLLHDVSLEVDAGELVVVWGPRRCGRSTLLRIAAGVEPPDAGTVRFAGRELTGRAAALGQGIGYCQRGVHGTEARGVLDQLLVAQLARGISQQTARERVFTALEQAGAAACASLEMNELDAGEATRVALARALVLEPSLILLDDPIRGVDLGERDSILSLLRSLADGGIAVLAATDDATGLSGADRALSLSEGTLRGEHTPHLAPVVPLRRQAIG
jgi:ABC-type multidrug transport system ATPase subunit